jgi:hypothetical protein
MVAEKEDFPAFPTRCIPAKKPWIGDHGGSKHCLSPRWLNKGNRLDG